MRLLAVTHWSFGRDRDLVREIRQTLDCEQIQLHDLRSDPDLNRTLVVFSGQHEEVRATAAQLATMIFPRIDLNRHRGEHERIGALDSCAFVIPFRDSSRQDTELAMGTTELLAATLSARYELPIFLTDKTSRSPEAEELELRKGGFGSLGEQPLAPDFGPSLAHPHLGVSLVGVRDFFLTFQFEFESPNGGFARTLAKEARELRTAGDPHFLGVEASSHSLNSRNRSRLTIEMDLPDLASPDPIVEWALDRSARAGIRAFGAELVGAARVSDLPGATRVSIRDSQILG